MKKCLAFMMILLLLLPAFALAEESEARIAELEARVAELEAENARLRAALAESAPEATDRDTYSLGQPWVVEGKWRLTLESVEEVEDRNPYSLTTPAAVYVLTYTYENIGYDDEFMDGLYMALDLGNIVDCEGMMGYMYPGDVAHYPQETPVGAKCEAQVCIGVDHAGDFGILYTKYVGGREERAVFTVDVD